MASLYNSCGETLSRPERAQISNQEFREKLKVNLHPDQRAQCQRSENYSCMQKIFAADAREGQESVTFPCVKVANGTEICASGTRRFYNSAYAESQCDDCSSSRDEGLYNFEEFHCYHSAFAVSGIYPVAFEGSTLENAINEVFSQCENLFAESVE